MVAVVVATAVAVVVVATAVVATEVGGAAMAVVSGYHLHGQQGAMHGEAHMSCIVLHHALDLAVHAASSSFAC